MKRYTCLLSLLFPLILTAQTYDAAAGLRVGTDWGVSAQLRLPVIHKNFTAEAIIQSSLQREEGQLTILGKRHYPVLSRRINLFMGGGVHFGWSDEIEDDEEVRGPVGIDGIIGAEVTFARINVSYDFKPAINLSGGSKVLNTQSAISVRYVIAKRNDIYDKGNERDRNKRRKKRSREKRREKRGKAWYEVWKKGNDK